MLNWQANEQSWFEEDELPLKSTGNKNSKCNVIEQESLTLDI